MKYNYIQDISIITTMTISDIEVLIQCLEHCQKNPMSIGNTYSIKKGLQELSAIHKEAHRSLKIDLEIYNAKENDNA